MSSNIVSYLASLGFWNWFILAGVLFAIEVMVPGTFFLWLGLSAFLDTGGKNVQFQHEFVNGFEGLGEPLPVHLLPKRCR